MRWISAAAGFVVYVTLIVGAVYSLAHWPVDTILVVLAFGAGIAVARHIWRR